MGYGHSGAWYDVACHGRCYRLRWGVAIFRGEDELPGVGPLTGGYPHRTTGLSLLLSAGDLLSGKHRIDARVLSPLEVTLIILHSAVVADAFFLQEFLGFGKFVGGNIV